MTCSQVCLELFGHTEPLSGYLFKPFRMRDLERWFGNRGSMSMRGYGESHSCYPFYTAFLEQRDAEKVRSCRIGSVLTPGQAKRVNRKCGFPKSHKKNLWYCPSCVREDIIRHGETCWRRLPQMPGAVYCPIHHEKLRESGTGFHEINYRIVPATYGLIHAPEPEQEPGNVFSGEYIRLAEDIAWLLDNGFSIPDDRWVAQNYMDATGKAVNAYLLHGLSGSVQRGNGFEDYLTNRLMKESGKEYISISISKQVGSILAIEKEFDSMEKFCSM